MLGVACERRGGGVCPVGDVEVRLLGSRLPGWRDGVRSPKGSLEGLEGQLLRPPAGPPEA